MSSLLQTVDLRRVFSETGENLEILKGVNFEMEAGELVALTGSSGSGKSTFLNLVGMLDTPTSGEILFKGKPLSKFNSQERDMYHRVQVGFVFQFHHLLSEFTAIENVCVPGRILGTSEKECREPPCFWKQWASRTALNTYLGNFPVVNASVWLLPVPL